MLTERSMQKAVKPVLLPWRENLFLVPYEALVICLASMQNTVADIHLQEKLAIRKTCVETQSSPDSISLVLPIAVAANWQQSLVTLSSIIFRSKQKVNALYQANPATPVLGTLVHAHDDVVDMVSRTGVLLHADC